MPIDKNQINNQIDANLPNANDRRNNATVVRALLKLVTGWVADAITQVTSYNTFKPIHRWTGSVLELQNPDGTFAPGVDLRGPGTPVSIQTSKNLFNRNAAGIQSDKGVSTNNGTIGNYSGFKLSELIAVKPGTSYTLSGAGAAPKGVQYCDSAGVSVGYVSVTAFPGVFVTPANCQKIQFTCKNNIDTDIPATLQLEEGAAATAYQPYAEPVADRVNGLPLQASSLKAGLTKGEPVLDGEVATLRTVKGLAPPTVAQQTANLFDKTKVVAGKEVNSAGAIVNRADDAVSDFIPVLPNQTYAISGFLAAAFRYMVVLGADKTTVLQSGAGVVVTTTRLTFTTVANAAFVVFSLQGRNAANNNYDTVQFELGNTPTDYKPFSLRLFDPLLSAQGLWNPVIYSDAALPGSPISRSFFGLNAVRKLTGGKLMVLFGDSITETTPEAGGARDNWPNYVTGLGLASIANFARSGSTYKDVTPNPWQRISVQIDRAITASVQPDLIVFSCGTNDGTVTPGSYATAMGKASLTDLDRTNLYEALRYCYWKAQTQWPSAVMFAVLPTQRADSETAALQPLYDAIRLMAGRYGLRVIDATNESGIVRDFESTASGTLAAPNSGRDLYDGLHPKVGGMQKIARLIVARILSHTAN